MKEINLKEINFKKLFKNQEKSDWKKSIYYILLILVISYVIFLVYVFLRPAPKVITEHINNELNAPEIKFDLKALEKIKAKNYPR